MRNNARHWALMALATLDGMSVGLVVSLILMTIVNRVGWGFAAVGAAVVVTVAGRWLLRRIVSKDLKGTGVPCWGDKNCK